MPTTPTQRTLTECRRRDWLAGTVERYQYSFAYRGVVEAAKGRGRESVHRAVHQLKRHGEGVRQDLFGFLDVLAMTGDSMLGIQATTHANLAARFTKMIADKREAVRICLSSGLRVEVWGWRKLEVRVDRRLWHVSVVRFSISAGVISATFPTGKIRTEDKF